MADNTPLLHDSSGPRLGDTSLKTAHFNFSSLGAYTPRMAQAKTPAEKVFLFLRGQYGFWSVVTVRLIVVLIMINILAYILSTDYTVSEYVTEETFEIIEGVSVAIFTIEHILRVWSAMGDPRYLDLGPFWGRLRYMRSFHAVVDMAAILPYYVDLVVPLHLNFTTALRVLRMSRLLKFDNYTKAFGTIKRVFYREKELLVVASFYTFVALLLCASALYLIESNNLNAFSTIPNSMFTMFQMFMGTFPDGPLTLAGKLMLVVAALTGLTLIYVPTGVFASGFLEVINETKEAEKAAAELKAQQAAMSSRASAAGAKSPRSQGVTIASPNTGNGPLSGPNTGSIKSGSLELSAGAVAGATQLLCPKCGHHFVAAV